MSKIHLVDEYATGLCDLLNSYAVLKEQLIRIKMQYAVLIVNRVVTGETMRCVEWPNLNKIDWNAVEINSGLDEMSISDKKGRKIFKWEEFPLKPDSDE